MSKVDVTGPHEVLTNVPGTEVIVASMDGSSIESHGLTFSNLTDLDRVEHCDVICIPGGLGCVEAIENHNFLSAIRRFYEHYRLEPQLVIEEQSAREQELAADFDCLALKWMF